MAIEITVPKLGLTMEEASLVAWKFKAGDAVKKEQIVLVLETDKVTFEMPSPGDGLLHPVAAAGSRIEVSQVVGYLAADAAELNRLAGQFPAAETGAPAAVLSAPAAAVRRLSRLRTRQGLSAGAGDRQGPWDRPFPGRRLRSRRPRGAGRRSGGG
jgi:pyruvate/2-oxoglutarate dehydrogenase complex dihydrolipoamide acyltransferase (E2) component